MKVLIVEDETPASERLKRSLTEVCPGIQVIGTTTSIESTVVYLRSGNMPDLLFMDIELSDGQSFEIFKRVRIDCPVIFITAYDHYWQKAFVQNSIDYLLKPIEKDRLVSALNKHQHVKQFYQHQYDHVATSLINASTKRLIVRRGTEFISIPYPDIAYFFASDKLVFMVCADGRRMLVPQTLIELESELDPKMFRRVNRRFIINQRSISKVSSLSKSRLLLQIEPSPSDRVVVTHENSRAFMQWLQGI